MLAILATIHQSLSTIPGTIILCIFAIALGLVISAVLARVLQDDDDMQRPWGDC